MTIVISMTTVTGVPTVTSTVTISMKRFKCIKLLSRLKKSDVELNYDTNMADKLSPSYNLSTILVLPRQEKKQQWLNEKTITIREKKL